MPLCEIRHLFCPRGYESSTQLVRLCLLLQSSTNSQTRPVVREWVPSLNKRTKCDDFLFLAKKLFPWNHGQPEYYRKPVISGCLLEASGGGSVADVVLVQCGEVRRRRRRCCRRQRLLLPQLQLLRPELESHLLLPNGQRGDFPGDHRPILIHNP